MASGFPNEIALLPAALGCSVLLAAAGAAAIVVENDGAKLVVAALDAALPNENPEELSAKLALGFSAADFVTSRPWSPELALGALLAASLFETSVLLLLLLVGKAKPPAALTTGFGAALAATPGTEDAGALLPKPKVGAELVLVPKLLKLEAGPVVGLATTGSLLAWDE